MSESSRLASLFMILLLAGAGLGDASQCRERDEPNKVFNEFDCLLHPGLVTTNEGHACPNQDPYLTITAYFSCEECAVTGPSRNFSATGVGDCVLDAPCEPFLESIHYDVAWAIITIQNMRQLAGFCTESTGDAQGSAHCGCPACDSTPILISLEDGAVFLSSAEDGVNFDLDADGEAERIAWTQAGSDEAFLVLDRNGNGFVDDGNELFGDATPQPVIDPAERNGFEALAVFDDSLSGGNEDGRIDENDAIFSSLRLWVDSNHDGVSNVGELRSLVEERLESIELDYRSSSRRDRHGNEFRYGSRAMIDGRTRIAWDVVFVGL